MCQAYPEAIEMNNAQAIRLLINYNDLRQVQIHLIYSDAHSLFTLVYTTSFRWIDGVTWT